MEAFNAREEGGGGESWSFGVLETVEIVFEFSSFVNMRLSSVLMKKIIRR